MDDSKRIFTYIHIGGYVASAILHAVGLYVLLKVRDLLENQRIIIFNLALAELLVSTFKAIGEISNKVNNNSEWVFITAFFSTFLMVTIKLSTEQIILDRFCDIYLGLKYQVYFTKQRNIKITCLSWILSGTFALTLTILAKTHLSIDGSYPVVIYLFFSLDLVITTSAIITYAYFFRKISQINKVEMRKLSAESRKSGQNVFHAKFQVPCLMVTTYLLFNVTAAVIIMAIHLLKYGNTPAGATLLQVSKFLIICGWIADALVYIFAKKRVREHIILCICPGFTSTTENVTSL